MFDVNELPVYSAFGHFRYVFTAVDAVSYYRFLSYSSDLSTASYLDFCDSLCKEVKQRLGWSPKVFYKDDFSTFNGEFEVGAAEGLELEPRAASAGSRLPTIVSGVDLSAYFSAAPTPAPAPAESSPALAELSLEEFILKVLSGSRLAVRRGFCEGEGIDSSDDDRSSWNPDECARAS